MGQTPPAPPPSPEKTCDERFRAAALDPRGLVAGTFILFEGDYYPVREGSRASAICTAADHKKAVFKEQAATIARLKKENGTQATEIDRLTRLAGEDNRLKRNYFTGWMGWVAFATLLTFCFGIVIGRVGRRR